KQAARRPPGAAPASGLRLCRDEAPQSAEVLLESESTPRANRPAHRANPQKPNEAWDPTDRKESPPKNPARSWAKSRQRVVGLPSYAFSTVTRFRCMLT